MKALGRLLRLGTLFSATVIALDASGRAQGAGGASSFSAERSRAAKAPEFPGDPDVHPAITGQISVSGEIAGSASWFSDELVNVTGDLTVSGRLTVRQGVRVRVAAGASLRVAAGGELRVNGTPALPVRFVGQGGERWSGLVFEAGATVAVSHALVQRTWNVGIEDQGASSVLTHVTVRDVLGRDAGDGAAGIRLTGGAPEVRSCTVSLVVGADGTSGADGATGRFGLEGAVGIPGQPGGRGKAGEPGGSGTPGGEAVGVDVGAATSATLAGNLIELVAGGHGGDGGAGGDGGVGGAGGDGFAAVQVGAGAGGRGARGGRGAAGGAGGDGGIGVGIRVDLAGSSTIEGNRILRVRGGNAGAGNDGGDGGKGGRGGAGAQVGGAFPAGPAPPGGPGGVGGRGGEGGRGGAAGDAISILIRESTIAGCYQNVCSDNRGGNASDGGSGGSGGDAGRGGDGGCCKVEPDGDGGDGGNGRAGGDGGVGGAGGAAGEARYIVVADAKSQVRVLHNSGKVLRRGSAGSGGAAGSAGAGSDGGLGGNAKFSPPNSSGSPGASGVDGTVGTDGLAGDAGEAIAMLASGAASTTTVVHRNNAYSIGTGAGTVGVAATDAARVESNFNVFGTPAVMAQGTVINGAKNVLASPDFLGTGSKNLRPSPASPVIDAGDSSATPLGLVEDFDGHPRELDDPATPDTGVGGASAVVDIGAFEYQLLTCTTDQVVLTPADHRMARVRFEIDLGSLAAAAPVLTVTAASSERDGSPGASLATGDVHGADGFSAPVDVTSAFVFDGTIGAAGGYRGTLRLRAEHGRPSPGRTYTVVATLTHAGGSSSALCVVRVPVL